MSKLNSSILFWNCLLKVTKAPPVKPKRPLQELKPATSDKLWSSSRPIDAVASKASLERHFFF